jgi:hypothetical protein
LGGCHSIVFAAILSSFSTLNNCPNYGVHYITALLLEASMNTANITDATAEDQAYYAAESGIQDTINALRGNSEYQKTSGDKIDYEMVKFSDTQNSRCSFVF